MQSLFKLFSTKYTEWQKTLIYPTVMPVILQVEIKGPLSCSSVAFLFVLIACHSFYIPAVSMLH